MSWLGCILLFSLTQRCISQNLYDPDIAIQIEELDDPKDGFNVTRPQGNLTVLTGYKFNKCNDTQQRILKETVEDAVYLAETGFDLEPTPGGPIKKLFPWGSQEAVDFFGPPEKSQPLQSKIYDSLDKASYAYPGWGLADWWTDRYVELSCEDLSPDKSCAEGKPWAAVTVNPNKDFGYPLICFCDGFFNVLPSLADADAKIDNDDKKLNVGRLKSRATTMLHEWFHMSWSNAQVMDGGSKDQQLVIGPPGNLNTTRAYKGGRTKLLAKTNAEAAAQNPDSYAYYCHARYMLFKTKVHTLYPKAWKSYFTWKQNTERDASWPGAPERDGSPSNNDNDGPGPEGPDPDEAPGDTITPSSTYPASMYPDWYQPIYSADLDDSTTATIGSVSEPIDPIVTTPTKTGVVRPQLPSDPAATFAA